MRKVMSIGSVALAVMLVWPGSVALGGEETQGLTGAGLVAQFKAAYADVRGEIEEQHGQSAQAARCSLGAFDVSTMLARAAGSDVPKYSLESLDDGNVPIIYASDAIDLEKELEDAEARVGSTGDETGTDPRDFSSKFMPYYLYTELKNGIKVNQLNLFGMYAFAPDIAMTYDWPVFKDIDYSSVIGGIPGGIGGGNAGSGAGAGLTPPFGDLSSGGSTTGFGDLNLRFFYKPKSWAGKYAEEGKSWNLIPLIETTLPTASDDVLGGNTTIVSPGLTFVADLPGGPPFGLGFVAMMNFYDFDIDEDKAGSDVERFRGRWFWMQPLAKPGPQLLDGIYVLTEFQPVYDFRTDDFDFWIGPELGKIVKDGVIVYVKPGTGFDRDSVDRRFTLECGIRYFF